MAYNNSRHRNRLLNINEAQNLFAHISFIDNRYPRKEYLEGTDQSFYLTPEIIGNNQSATVFNMPFLLMSDGQPWVEANSYLCSLMENKAVFNRPTDDVRRRASRLLEYKLFTEDEGIDWLDFSGKRVASRPTYRFFYYLNEVRNLSPTVANQYTYDIYKFYQYVSKKWYDIDIDRVDKTKTINIYYNSAKSSGSIERLKRSQTKLVPSMANVPSGYVRDQGEILRPLKKEEIIELKSVINSANWTPIERLIILISMMTGARKQTVLSLRVKHVHELTAAKPESDGTLKLYVGPGTLVDTKKNKRQVLYFPPQLVDELSLYLSSKEAKNRRIKFTNTFKQEHPNLSLLKEDDNYFFLSDQGNCYYMGKDDPRYPLIKTVPSGQVANQLKRKILKTANQEFPKDFYFHWLRATYAFLLWLSLQKDIKKGTITESDALSFIQKRLYHKDRKTTENYLKLFKGLDFQIEAQEAFEDLIFPSLII
jgi:hypothetical protein